MGGYLSRYRPISERKYQIHMSGFMMETVSNKKVVMTIWDAGGRHKIRALYRYYYRRTEAVVFVVDSNDKERIDQAKDELFQMLAEDELANCPVLILANKQDLPNAMTVDEVTNELGLNDIKQKWAIFPTIATKTISILEAFDWLSAVLESRDLKNALVNPVADAITDVQTSVTKTKLSFSSVLQKPYEQMKKWLSPA